MKRPIAARSAFSCGVKALDYLRQIRCNNVVIISDSKEENIAIVEKIHAIMEEKDICISEYKRVSRHPALHELLMGVATLKQQVPDTIIAVGEENVINAVKIMMILYEYPEIDFEHIDDNETDSLKLQTKLVVVPAHSETTEEVSQITSIMFDCTDIKKERAGC